MNIDWSKAPEGFPLWLEGTNEDHRKHSGWYRNAGQVFEGAHGGQWRAVREWQFFTVHSKPEWTGEGLPPTGTTCEYGTGNSWGECTVLHVGSRYMLIAANGHEEVPIYHSSFYFRPIRTPEQIAAEEREQARTEILNAMTADGKLSYETEEQWQCRLNVVGEMLDMGYRKQVTE